MKQQFADHSGDSGTADEALPAGRRLLDVLLVTLCVLLLLAVGIMLHGDLPFSPWAPPPGPAPAPAPGPTPGPFPDIAPTADPEDGPRGRLMTLGFALLLLSLAVCLYAMYRLGFCCQRRHYNRGRLRSGIPSVNSRLHIVSAADLPPTYDAIMLSHSHREVQPPSYFTIVLQNEKASAPVGARPQEAG